MISLFCSYGQGRIQGGGLRILTPLPNICLARKNVSKIHRIKFLVGFLTFFIVNPLPPRTKILNAALLMTRILVSVDDSISANQVSMRLSI